MDWQALGYTPEEIATLSQPQGAATEGAEAYFPALDTGDPPNE